MVNLSKLKSGPWLLTSDFGKNLKDRGEAKQAGTLDLPHSVPGSVRGIKEQSEAHSLWLMTTKIYLNQLRNSICNG